MFSLFRWFFLIYYACMNILIADKLSDKAVAALKAMGAIIRVEPSLGADDLPGAIGDSDVLVVRSTKVSAATIDASSRSLDWTEEPTIRGWPSHT